MKILEVRLVVNMDMDTQQIQVKMALVLLVPLLPQSLDLQALVGTLEEAHTMVINNINNNLNKNNKT